MTAGKPRQRRREGAPSRFTFGAELVALALAGAFAIGFAVGAGLSRWLHVGLLIVGGCVVLLSIVACVCLWAFLKKSEYGAGNTVAGCAWCGGPIVVSRANHGGSMKCDTCGAENRIGGDGTPVPKPSPPEWESRCASCQGPIPIPEALAGHTVKCPACGTQLKAPSLEMLRYLTRVTRER